MLHLAAAKKIQKSNFVIWIERLLECIVPVQLLRDGLQRFNFFIHFRLLYVLYPFRIAHRRG